MRSRSIGHGSGSWDDPGPLNQIYVLTNADMSNLSYFGMQYDHISSLL